MGRNLRHFPGTLPKAVLPLFKNHGYTLWSETVRMHKPNWNFPNSILIQLLVHLTLTQKMKPSQKEKLIGLIEFHIEYVNSQGALTIKQKTFIKMVHLNLPKASAVASSYPHFMKYKMKAA